MELSTNRKIDNRKVNDTKSNRKCHLDTDVEKKRTSFHSDFKKSASYLMNDSRLVSFSGISSLSHSCDPTSKTRRIYVEGTETQLYDLFVISLFAALGEFRYIHPES